MVKINQLIFLISGYRITYDSGQKIDALSEFFCIRKYIEHYCYLNVLYYKTDFRF